MMRPQTVTHSNIHPHGPCSRNSIRYQAHDVYVTKHVIQSSSLSLPNSSPLKTLDTDSADPIEDRRLLLVEAAEAPTGRRGRLGRNDAEGIPNPAFALGFRFTGLKSRFGLRCAGRSPRAHVCHRTSVSNAHTPVLALGSGVGEIKGTLLADASVDYHVVH